jgi:hypothetical protein
MRFQNAETPTFAGSDGTGNRPDYAESMTLFDRDGNEVAVFGKTVAGVVSLTVGGDTAFVPASVPEIPATPTEQDIADALVTLGLVTQAEA